MADHVTLLRPEAPSSGGRGLSSSLPPDLMEQVRGRLRALALIILLAFAIDPAFFFGTWIYVKVSHITPPDKFTRDAAFYWADLGVVAASAGLWWVAGSRRISAVRLHSVGLVYEVLICFVIALRTFWEYYRDTGILPNLTWVPAVVILFPLILPAPPRVMLAAAITSAAMAPLALLLLEVTGKVTAGLDAYINTIIGAAIGIGFAYMGSRVVYRLGREVAAARELGSYRLEEKLGQGGMGEVWRARHRMLARPAAIKLIRPALRGTDNAGAPAELISRFEREAQATASLRSPHTVELFDFGVAADGSFYYAMELLDGIDANTLVKQYGPLPAERAVYLLRQVCHSLSEADSRGLVHRDIKPANIFLCQYGEEHDFVKVLDFGLVKALEDGADPGRDLSREHAVHGTPAFMAPEQAMGSARLDGRADIYATGCVAYWLLTGELVFNADTPMALLMHHVQRPPSPPSTRTEMPIPVALDSLVIECLAKDPADRPQSAKELSRRLAAALDGASPWTEDRARQWWTQHRPTVGH